jgi:outer membrane protein assembly factor BamE (lipoprotein component of BamABCDE complex)
MKIKTFMAAPFYDYMVHTRNLSILFVIVAIFAASGCVIPFYSEPVNIPPADFNISSLNESLRGSSKQEVIRKLGAPSYAFRNEEEDFLIYKRMGNEIVLLGVPGMNGYPVYCYSMEFNREGVLHKVKKFDCNAIPELKANTLRAEAKQGQIDSAAVLAVQYGEKEYLKELSINDINAQRSLSLIEYGENYKGKSLLGLTDDDLRKHALDGNPEASYQLYWNKAAPDPYYWLCHSADLGQSQARYRIGLLYWNGAEGIRQDYIESYKWYALAAEVGNYEAWKEIRRINNEVFDGVDAERAEASIRSWIKGQCEQTLIPINTYER